MVGVLGLELLILVSTQLDRALSDLEASPDITAVHRHFSGDKIETSRLNDRLYPLEALLQNYLDLVECVGLVDEPVIANS